MLIGGLLLIVVAVVLFEVQHFGFYNFYGGEGYKWYFYGLVGVVGLVGLVLVGLSFVKSE
jgi:hypothetical protein